LSVARFSYRRSRFSQSEVLIFYTKYRPQKFSRISKPNNVAEALANQVKKGKIAHAYLFIGPRGTGKTTTARILAKALNCKNVDKKGDPCDKCDECKTVKDGSFIDLIEIDAASNRGIDDIRDLRDRINLAPARGGQKVYIIDEVHMLTTEAFNALLKTLEEPPAHATFILCTTEESKVPETIKSRCHVFKFKRATVAQIVEKLKEIAKEEGAKVGDEDLKKIAQAAFGGFRDAETILEQVVDGSLSVDAFLGTGTKKDFVDFVDMLLSADSNSAIRKINKLYDDGVDLYVWAIELVSYLRDLLFVSVDSYEGLVDATDEVLSKMDEQANKLEVFQLTGMINAFVIAQNEVKSSFIAQLPLELAIVKICDLMSDGVVGSDNDPSNSNDSSVKKASKKERTGKVSLKKVKNDWSKVLKEAVSHNGSVQGLLRATQPSEILGDSIILEVYYKFHKERLESPKNKRIVETVLEKVFAVPLKVKCVLSEKRVAKKPALTDHNVTVPSGDAVAGDILDVFDGSLPI
jgi:DNA polymerase III subunit gamma/tau